jgi:hypothetical protein
MALPEFQKSGAPNVTFDRGRVFPVSEPVEVYQHRYDTEGLNTKVVSYGVQNNFINASFTGLSAANKTALENFFNDPDVNWSENTFTFVDENSVSRTVRLWQDRFNMVETSPNRFSVTFLLKDES